MNIKTLLILSLFIILSHSITSEEIEFIDVELNSELEDKINNAIEFILKDSLYNEFIKLDTSKGFTIEEELQISLSGLYLTEHVLFEKEFSNLLDSSLNDSENFEALIKLDSINNCEKTLNLNNIIYNCGNDYSILYFDYNCLINAMNIRVNFVSIDYKSIQIEYFFKFENNEPTLLYRYIVN